MKLNMRVVVLVAQFCFFIAIRVPAQGPEIPSVIAEQRTKEIIQLIDSGDRRAARAYIKQNYSAAALKEESLEDRLDTISYLHDLTRGVELQSLQGSQPNSAKALV